MDIFYLDWNSANVLQKVFLHWKYSQIRPLHLGPYLKGQWMNQKAKCYTSGITVKILSQHERSLLIQDVRCISHKF